ncbi:conserved hypothetical protein [Segniliparus rotundus DSM 44985]|uniref:Lipoprotein n=1 Tax=Segniliparus rotundus (strain ATCC BAA-972 / CDC 1076 / CIP 108378 / DSM 44985 / JCM 13578) TaxID=640132 RepID=D6ZDE7_SEGRD|nr:hypothetical protein [Segniliparus rotundus]ADG97211.1 conserved hypothetical protein [Segniliparus rotundus DSM 44985]
MRQFTAIAVALITLGSAGCASRPPSTNSTAAKSQDQQQDDPDKKWKGEIRHDLEPLKKRLRNIGDDYTATWAGGYYGDPRVPGPGAYWLDAVIRLTPDITQNLAKQLGDSPRQETPKIKSELRGLLPPGKAETSDELDSYINTANPLSHKQAHGFLYPKSNTLVVNYFEAS